MDEKVFFKNSNGNSLCGVLTTPKENSNICVVIGHGFTANKDRPRFLEAAKLFSKNGFAVFRFDFTGSGESEKIPIDSKTQIGDLESALKFARGKGFEKIFLVCESMCGTYAPQVQEGLFDELIFWVPRTIPGTPRSLEGPRLIEIMEKGQVVFDREGTKFIITKKFVGELNSLNQAKLLAKLKKPILIIEGSKDMFLDANRNAMHLFPKGSELKIIDGMEHSYGKYTQEVLKLTLDRLLKLRNSA